jgi:AraC-type DNA-binding domain-containing proteins
MNIYQEHDVKLDALAKTVDLLDGYFYHWHDYYEIAVIIEGRSDFLIGATRYSMEKGDLMFIRPYELHTCYKFPGVDCKTFVLQFTHEFAGDKFNRDNDSRYLNLYTHNKSNPAYLYRYPFACCDEVFSLLDGTYKEFSDKLPGYESNLRGYIALLLGYFERYGGLSQSVPNSADDKFNIGKICRYIEDNIGSGLTLDAAARLTNYSRSQFSSKFKELVGCSFREYLEFVRVREAQRLLYIEKLSVAETAYRLGYGHANNFSRAYKRVTGVNPAI